MSAVDGSPRIALAREEDVETVVALLGEFRDWFGKSEPANAQMRESVERIRAEGNAEYLLAWLGGEPVGVCQLRYRWSVWASGYDCWLEDLFVREHARGRGLGRRLVEAACELATERGARRIELDVNEHNENAIALYVSCGFELDYKPPGRSFFIGRRLGG